MIKIYCDSCSTELIYYVENKIFGYDCCQSPICEAKLTIEAERNYKALSSSLIPTAEQVKEAEEILRRTNG